MTRFRTGLLAAAVFVQVALTGLGSAAARHSWSVDYLLLVLAGVSADSGISLWSVS